MNEKLSTIQTENNLNAIYREGKPGPGGAYHAYKITRADDPEAVITYVQFQEGPRSDPEAIHGVLNGDLLELVRDQLIAFQAGEFACDENAECLSHVEAALFALKARADARAKRGVLGTTNK